MLNPQRPPNCYNFLLSINGLYKHEPTSDKAAWNGSASESAAVGKAARSWKEQSL